jgi:hypothetical protein
MATRQYSRREVIASILGIGVTAALAGIGVYSIFRPPEREKSEEPTHQPKEPTHQPEAIVVNQATTKTVYQPQPAATPLTQVTEEFSDYLAFGDQGQPISKLPELLEDNAAKLKGYFTVAKRYVIPLAPESKVRLILNDQNPAGYDPNNIVGLGFLTLEPTRYDSADGISAVMNYGVRSGDRREIRLSIHDIRSLDLDKGDDIVVYIKQTDENYKLVGRV